jgi:hypothetical protein
MPLTDGVIESSTNRLLQGGSGVKIWSVVKSRKWGEAKIGYL